MSTPKKVIFPVCGVKWSVYWETCSLLCRESNHEYLRDFYDLPPQPPFLKVLLLAFKASEHVSDSCSFPQQLL